MLPEMELEPDSSSSSEESQDVESEQSSSSDVEATMEDAIRDVLQNPEGETPEGDEDDDYDEDEPLAAEAAPSAEEVVGDPQNTDQPAEVDEDAEFIKMLRENDVPLGKIERFQELITDRNQYKTDLDELSGVKDQLAQIQIAGQTAGLDQEQLARLFSLPMMMSQDPEAALEAINGFRDMVSTRVGDIIPDDLQQKVNDGYMDEPSARELAKARATADFETRRSDQVEADREADSQAKARNSVVDAVNTFQKTLKESDPDYDQKHKYVKRELAELARANPPRTPGEAVELAKQAHKTVTDELGALQPPPVSRRTISGRRSNRSATAAPKTMAEAIAAAVS